MGNFLAGFLVPLILLSAAMVDWNLICLIDFIAFLVLQFDASKSAIYGRGIRSITGAWWAKLFGFQLFCRDPLQISCWGGFLAILQQLGSRLRIACCLLLPAIQLIAGISYPSWISLPYFIASCVGLVDWSLTRNFLGLFRWWRALQVYAGFNLVLLYAYQLPVVVTGFVWVADFISLYRLTATTQWPKISSGLALVFFYLVVVIPSSGWSSAYHLVFFIINLVYGLS